MKFKEVIFGAKDKDPKAPENVESYQKSVEAGQKFAAFIKLDKFVAWFRSIAEKNPKRFLWTTFCVIGLLMIWNIASLATACSRFNEATTAVEVQRKALNSAIQAREMHKSGAYKQTPGFEEAKPMNEDKWSEHLKEAARKAIEESEAFEDMNKKKDE